MTILPVLDLLRGQVVRGVAGHRSEYRPIISHLTSSCNPSDIAWAIRRAFGMSRFYIADLDAILEKRPNLDLYRQLKEDGFDLVIDAGVSNLDEARILKDIGIVSLIVGLESCPSPDDLAAVCLDWSDVIFSLDLMCGHPRFCEGHRGWSDDPREIIRQVAKLNVSAILPLDLADVGMGTGGSTDALCSYVRTAFPAIRLMAGGGVSGQRDLRRFRELGVDEVLVASALHDGRLQPSDLFNPNLRPQSTTDS